MPLPLPRSDRLRSVDVLRAVAALWILLYHVSFRAADVAERTARWASLPIKVGHFRVTLFLVLSGYCIHRSIARGMARGNGVRPRWKEFWQRRFWRLYPPYLGALAVSLAVLAALGRAPAKAGALPYDLATHLLFVHNIFHGYCFGLGNAPLWAMGLEEQLYLGYALYLASRRRWPVWWIASLILAVGATWQVGWRIHLGDASPWGEGLEHWGNGPLALGRWLQWPVGWWFAWTLGAVAAEADAGVIRLPRWAYYFRFAAGLALLGLVMDRMVLVTLARAAGQALSVSWLAAATGVSEFLFAGAAFVTVNACVRRERAGGFGGPAARVLARLGLISYSLYLTHDPLLQLFESTGWFGDSLKSTALRYAVQVPACVAFAFLFYWLVESHFVGAGKPSVGDAAELPPPAAGRPLAATSLEVV